MSSNGHAEAKLQDRTPAPQPPPRPPANAVRRPVLIILVIALVLFIYGLLADRSTPYTSQATVQAYIVKIAPEVAGKVTEVAVGDNARVAAGDVLLQIDREPYRLAVERAAAQLEMAGQSVGSSTATVAAAEANRATAMAERENVRRQSARIFELVRKGVSSEARSDQGKAALASAEAAVSRAEAELEKARQGLGAAGAANAQIRDATAALGRAQLDLASTTLYAPSDGVVTNLQLGIGEFVGVGQAAMTYIDIREIWVDAAFRENTLENIKAGNRVDIVLDIRPGRIFKGRIESIGFGVSSQESDPQTGLRKLRNHSGWIRDPQPIPIRIDFDIAAPPTGVRLGSQANVIVYTSGNNFMNALAWLRIRLVACLTYVS
jgi:multidrug resistance efflux pump